MPLVSCYKKVSLSKTSSTIQQLNRSTIQHCLISKGTFINCCERYEANGAGETGVYKRVHEDFEHRSTK